MLEDDMFSGGEEELSQEEQEWYEELKELAQAYGESVAHVEAWIVGFHQGKTPEETFYEDYPQYNLPEDLGKEIEP